MYIECTCILVLYAFWHILAAYVCIALSAFRHVVTGSQTVPSVFPVPRLMDEKALKRANRLAGAFWHGVGLFYALKRWPSL